MPVHIDIQSGVGVLTLDRPERANAYDSAMLEAVDAGIHDIEDCADLIVIRSTGSGAFCGGADLNALQHAQPIDALELASQRIFNHLANSRLISIAALQGPAVGGGCELALACDLRVVGNQATLRLPEASHGLIPAAGGCTRLTQLVGASLAKQVILFGHELDAARCVALGLAVGPCPDPFARALELAQRFLKNTDPIAARLAKQIIDRAPTDASLREERLAEAVLYGRRNKKTTR